MSGFVPRRLLRLLTLVLVLLALITPGRSTATTVNIGWTAWSDAEFVTKLVRRLIETRLGHTVELILLDIALQYQGVANGDLDLMLMAWLPDTHADYWERYGQRLVDAGVLYDGARLGWVVPAYVPEDELGVISDLVKPRVANRLHRQIYGIDPGAGLMRLSENAMKTYGLEQYTLIASSGAAMTAMVERSWRRQRWIVATAWRPHWMFQKWDLRFLQDPEQALGGRERIHAMVRRGLHRDRPDVVEFLGRISIEIEELEAMMALARDSDYETAVTEYINKHPEQIDYWLEGTGSGVQVRGSRLNPEP